MTIKTDIELFDILETYNITKDEVRENEDIVYILRLLYSYKTTLPKHLRLELSINNLYDDFYHIRFIINDEEEEFSVALFTLMFNMNNIFPLQIAFDGKKVKCKNKVDLEYKLNTLFNKDFKRDLSI